VTHDDGAGLEIDVVDVEGNQLPRAQPRIEEHHQRGGVAQPHQGSVAGGE